VLAMSDTFNIGVKTFGFHNRRRIPPGGPRGFGLLFAKSPSTLIATDDHTPADEKPLPRTPSKANGQKCPSHHLSRTDQSFRFRRRRALVITDTELKLMAAAAKMGLSSRPMKG
jgi:hypothetical protein